MRYLDRLAVRLSQIPEFSGMEKDERKRIVRSCRWKVFRHWQYWLTCIAVFFFSMIFSGVIFSWYINLKIRFFSQSLMTVSALFSVFLFLALLFLAQQIKIYYLAPFFVKAVTDKVNNTEVDIEHIRSQQLRKSTIKRGLWCFAPLLLIVGVCVVFATRNPGEYGASLKMPAALTTPRVVVNKTGLMRNVFIEDARLGNVTDIVSRNDPSGKLKETIIAGSRGALFTGTGLPTRFVRFDERQDHVNSIQLNSHGAFGFMNRGAWCSEARVMDESGRLIWSYGGGLNGIDDMASGDLDGDGIPEFAVGFNGGGGIHLLNRQGKKLWGFPDGNVWHVEIADVNGNGQKKIVHSNACGNITVRDKQGKIISKSKPEPYFSHFSLIRWPTASSPEQLLQVDENAIWILDTSANTLAKFPAPDSGALGEGKGALIAINDEKRALATIVDYENWHRSILYIHDLSGALLYQEILPDSCSTIAVLPKSEGQLKMLVIGCEGKVIEYQIQH